MKTVSKQFIIKSAVTLPALSPRHNGFSTKRVQPKFLQCIIEPQVPRETSQKPQCRTRLEASTYLNRMQIEINIKSEPGREHSCDLFATMPPLPSDYQTGLSDDNLFSLFCRETRLRGETLGAQP